MGARSMKIIQHEQGSQNWLKWRRSLLTATDAPIILKQSAYTLPFQLWQRKLGMVEEQPVNKAMQRGSDLEPIARKWFNDKYDLDMKPVVVESIEYNFLGASLDGISNSGFHLLEIKCNGPRNHGIAQLGEVPDYHMTQMQHQFICTRSQIGYYLSYVEGDEIVIEVTPNPDFERFYLPIARKFWENVVFLEPPASF